LVELERIKMKIKKFEEFLGFVEVMTTKYKFFRLIDGRLQAFVVGRDGIIIHSEMKRPDHKSILDIVAKGFIETELNKEEIELMGL